MSRKPLLTAEQRAFVRDIERRKNEALAQFPTRSELAKKFGVGLHTIACACRGRFYKSDPAK